MVSRYRLVALAVLAVLLLSGCYSLAEPSFRPGDSRDLFFSISRRVESNEPLAGESACADPGLIGNAMYLRASIEADPQPRDVYIYSFRTRSWDDSKDAVDACQAEYQAAHPGATVSRLDIPIWRVFGAGWSPELTLALTEALEEAHDAG